MARQFDFPDVKDRSVNEPLFLVSPQQILGFYNQETRQKELMVNTEILDWYTKYAIAHGWSTVKVTGKQILLMASF